MMDTYIMTSDTMEAVPLVAAHMKAGKSKNQTERQNKASGGLVIAFTVQKVFIILQNKMCKYCYINAY